MGGKPKTPQKTDEERKAERRAIEIQEEQLQLAKEQAAKPVPKPPKLLPLSPAPSQSSGDAFQAAQDAKKRALRRTNAGRGTLLAGETGGYGSRSATLLG